MRHLLVFISMLATSSYMSLASAEELPKIAPVSCNEVFAHYGPLVDHPIQVDPGHVVEVLPGALWTAVVGEDNYLLPITIKAPGNQKFVNNLMEAAAEGKLWYGIYVDHDTPRPILQGILLYEIPSGGVCLIFPYGEEVTIDRHNYPVIYYNALVEFERLNDLQ